MDTGKTAKRRGLLAAATSLLMMGALCIPTTVYASGADGGNFTCSLSGVPGWGYVNASYYHPTRRHYATAMGKGKQTTWADAKKTAKARSGRGVTGNKCWYGFAK